MHNSFCLCITFHNVSPVSMSANKFEMMCIYVSFMQILKTAVNVLNVFLLYQYLRFLHCSTQELCATQMSATLLQLTCLNLL